MGTSGNLLCCLSEVKSDLSCDGEHGIALESLQVNQASSRRGGNLVVFLKFWREALGSSQVMTGDFRQPLMLPQGSQASFQVARENSGFLSGCCRGIGPHLE